MSRLLSRRLPWVVGLALLLVGLPASAMMIAPAPVPQRVAQADVVVIGKVTAIEEKPVLATAAPGVKEKTEYHVAIIKVQDALLGAKGLTHIKVGFIIPPPAPPVKPGGPVLLIKRRPTVKFNVDQEVCVFLKRHHDGDFYVAAAYFDVIDKKNANFEKDVEQAKKAAKVLADPMASLKSKSADERTFTACLLVSRYRAWRRPNAKTESIEADESKLILTALADADFAKPIAPNTVMPRTAFAQLNLTDKDGWVWKPAPNTPATAYGEAAKRWLKEHADTYRIQRFVDAKKDDTKEK